MPLAKSAEKKKWVRSSLIFLLTAVFCTLPVSCAANKPDLPAGTTASPTASASPADTATPARSAVTPQASPTPAPLPSATTAAALKTPAQTATQAAAATLKSTQKPAARPTARPAVKATVRPTVKPAVKRTAAFTARPKATKEPSATPAPASGGLKTQESKMISLVNGEREKAGLKALKYDGTLRAGALHHSNDMSHNDFFSHTSPSFGSFTQRLSAARVSYTSAGENIAMYGSVEKAHTALMNSAGHRANILGEKFTRIGIGIVYNKARGVYYITQWFAK